MSGLSLSKQTPGRLGRALEYLRDLWDRREFALALGLGNLKARNASTVLGLFWWVLNPLLLGAVYYFVVIALFGRRDEAFLTYLLSGMFVFHFTGHALTGGANSIIQNAKLLANLRFPRLILPVSSLIESTVGFVTALGVFAVIAVVAGQANFTYRVVYLPAIIAIHLMFNLGLGSLAARLAVPFRDINNLIPYVNRIWLYTSPILWPVDAIANYDPGVQTLVQVNPLFSIIGVYRSALLGTPFRSDEIIGMLLWAGGVGLFGVFMFIRYEGRMVRHL